VLRRVVEFHNICQGLID